MHIVGDIGGTWMRIAGFENGKIINVQKRKTPETYTDFVDNIFEMSEEIADGREIQNAVIGVAGLVDGKGGLIVHSPNIPYLSGQLLQNDISSLSNGTICLENDACLSGLGEAIKGSGAGHKVVAYISIGTGVGGTRIDNGKIDENSFGFEPGHHILAIEGGQALEWESLVSGRSIKNKYGKNAEEIKDNKIWDEMARYTAIGVYNTGLYWSPDIIVLGGSMINGNPAISLDVVRREIDKMAFHPGAIVPIAKSTHGDNSGLVGASILL